MNWLNDNNLDVFEKLIESKKADPIDIRELLFGLYQVDITREIQEQFVYLKHSKLQPSEIKEMQYWEWQMMLEELRDYIEKEKEEHEKETGGHKNLTKNKDYQRAQKDMSKNMPKINPAGGGFKMPNMSNFKL